MKRSDPAQTYWEACQGEIRQAVREGCGAVCTYLLCAMTLERCRVYFSFLADQVPGLDALAGYHGIPDGLERLLREGGGAVPEAPEQWEGWCMQMEALAESLHISYQSPWQLQLLPGMLEQLGTFFSNWRRFGSLFGEDAADLALLGAWVLFQYERTHKYPNPKHFNFYTYLRSRHPELDAIGRQRDALRLKLAESVMYLEDYNAISEVYKRECSKYWGEAAAERKRLAGYAPPAAPEERFSLTLAELERIREDIRFLAEREPSAEDVRRRLQKYRRLDIAAEGAAG